MIKLAKNLDLPVAAVTQKFAFLGRTGGGKSYAATKLAEGMLLIGAQIIALDVVGNWYGLRVPKKKGQKAFDILVFGGRNGDIEINPKAGKIVAGIILEKNLSAVIDISEFISSEQMRFAYDFLTAFFEGRKARPAACHLFIEEAQELVPQNVPPGTKGEESFGAKMLHAGERILKIGRNYGVGASIITQRPQDVNKKVLNQTEVLLAFQMTGIQEKDTVKKWVSEKGQDENYAEMLPKLETGHALIWSPAWLKISGTYKILEKLTADVSATPEVGATPSAANQLAPVDVEELKGSIAALTEEMEANTPAALKKKIAELEKELSGLNKKPLADPQREKELNEWANSLNKAGDELVRREAAVVSAENQILAKVETVLTEANELIAKRLYDLQQEFSKILRLPASTSQIGNRPLKLVAFSSPSSERPKQAMPRKPAENITRTITGNSKVSGPQQKLLDTLKLFETFGLASVKRSNLAAFSGVSPRSSGFEKNLSTLRNHPDGALVDYLPGSCVALTAAGRSIGREPSDLAIARNEDLLNAWCQHISTPQGILLRILFGNYPERLDRAALADEAGVSVNSSGFEKNLSTLRSLGLIDYGPNKTVFATELLFPFD
jgi:hypothetical protein